MLDEKDNNFGAADGTERQRKPETEMHHHFLVSKTKGSSLSQSVGQSVRPSVSRSVIQSVSPLVC